MLLRLAIAAASRVPSAAPQLVRGGVRSLSTLSPAVQAALAKHAIAFKGFEYRVVGKAPPDVAKGVVKHYFAQPVTESADGSALGGEKVLTTQHASKKHKSSKHLLLFQGTQDKHCHPGPRVLDIFSEEEFFIYAGGDLRRVEHLETIPLLKIRFPAGSYIQVRFPPYFIHGFEGRSFGATSVHYTDEQEARATGRATQDIQTKDAMAALTRVLDQRKLRTVLEVDQAELAAFVAGMRKVQR